MIARSRGFGMLCSEVPMPTDYRMITVVFSVFMSIVLPVLATAYVNFTRNGRRFGLKTLFLVFTGAAIISAICGYFVRH
jgi:hypothetical protein